MAKKVVKENIKEITNEEKLNQKVKELKAKLSESENMLKTCEEEKRYLSEAVHGKDIEISELKKEKQALIDNHKAEIESQANNFDNRFQDAADAVNRRIDELQELLRLDLPCFEMIDKFLSEFDKVESIKENTGLIQLREMLQLGLDMGKNVREDLIIKIQK